MTRILVQRGSTGSSSLNLSRSSSLPGPSAFSTHQVPSAAKDGEVNEEVSELVASDEHLECSRSSENKGVKDDPLVENLRNDRNGSSSDAIAEAEKVNTLAALGLCDMMNNSGEKVAPETEVSSGEPSPIGGRSSHPPPPPAPPRKPSSENLNSRRFASGSSNPVRAGSSRRAVAWPIISTRTSPSESRPSSPRSHGENEGYNSADEQSPCLVFLLKKFDLKLMLGERERQFEIDIRLAKGLEVKRMLEDGNCLFRAVADQVYGDFGAYHLIRQMCIDYMVLDGRPKMHVNFKPSGTVWTVSAFNLSNEYDQSLGFEDVYGNNVEIQALSEMYNRPIHIYSYSIEPINIFHGSYNTDTPPIRLSYHHGNHYNSLVDPRRLTIGAGLDLAVFKGFVYILFSALLLLCPLTNLDKNPVKAAIKAQQDQQIDNASIFDNLELALLAEGRFYSDLELTEKEIERMVMEASRAEYLGNDKFKMHVERASTAEPSSSGARSESSKVEGSKEQVLSSGMELVLSMGFSYLQAIEVYSILGDDVESMVCYLLETGSSSRREGKATEPSNERMQSQRQGNIRLKNSICSKTECMEERVMATFWGTDG
ncbi:hypothetical protein CXB51_016579 [Gossypium anomalum]|uniref:ubiquitinyl hydrolase 1 n=1 Tax=Gossypium anomalum TaxID=47600 RepID=A0A8J5YWQ8_9ROSI|nr:hypothetical protein CXB51_016579 [Gossypium anomalum]